MGKVFGIVKWVGIFILLSIAALVGLPQLPVLQDMVTGSGGSRTYLEDNALALDPELADLGLSFPDEFYDNRFFMLAEIHGFADVQLFDLALLRHLHEKVGARTYLAELSPDQAMAFNIMVIDGDDRAARQVFDDWAERDAQWANKEFFGKLAAIQAFNATLPDDEKIVFIGTDKPRNLEAAQELAVRAFPAADPGFGSLAARRAVNDLILVEALLRPKDAGRYSHIVPNVSMVANLPGADEETFYGLWGLFHGSKVEINGTRPLAMRLNAENGPFPDVVATVGTLCITDCFNMMPARALPGPLRGADKEAYTMVPMSYDNAYLARVRGAGALKSALGNASAMVLPLGLEGTPYTSGQQLIGATGLVTMVQSFRYEGPAAEAMDAVVVYQGSAALTPWSGEIYDVSGQGQTTE